MEYGEIVLEHRPIVICQCEYDKCLVCNIAKESHPDKDDWDDERFNSHNFYQRANITGPRVVIDNKTFRGKCFRCKKEYQVSVQEVINAPVN
jgi:hypothetical protein